MHRLTPLTMLCHSCRASMASLPIEPPTDVWEEIAKHLDGNDKVRSLYVPSQWKRTVTRGVSAAGLLVHAGQPGTVLQSK